jgi:hypothetical protein
MIKKVSSAHHFRKEKEENVRKCSFSPRNCKPIFKKVMHIGGKIMQQVLTLRRIILIFGFVLVFIGCEINKAETNSVPDLTIIAEGLSEGILFNFYNIPENATNLWIYVYLEVPTDDEMSTLVDIQGNQLDQLRKTEKLVCPFVKNGHKYRITVISVLESGYKHFSTTVVTNGGIYLINKPSLFWNNDNSVTLSAKPEFSGNVFDTESYTFGYGAVIRVENGGIGDRSYSNELTFDVSQMVNEIGKSNGLTGNLTVFADISVTLEYEKIQWLVFFATTEDVIVSL